MADTNYSEYFQTTAVFMDGAKGSASQSGGVIRRYRNDEGVETSEKTSIYWSWSRKDRNDKGKVTFMIIVEGKETLEFDTPKAAVDAYVESQR